MKARNLMVLAAAAALSSQAALSLEDSPAHKEDTMLLGQEWDKKFPKSDKVDHQKVTFKNRYGITLAADLLKKRLRLGFGRKDTGEPGLAPGFANLGELHAPFARVLACQDFTARAVFVVSSFCHVRSLSSDAASRNSSCAHANRHSCFDGDWLS
jgi:hypothetical protein